MHQLEHHEISNEERKFPLVVVCDDITSPENVGMIFRIGEAMGVGCIYLCGDTPGPEHKRVKKTSRSTEKYLSYSHAPNSKALLHTLKSEGYTSIALEITDKSKVIDGVDFSRYEKIALILGNEQHGVSADVLGMADDSVEIAMFGRNTSINVVNSLSIALYEITRQLK